MMIQPEGVLLVAIVPLDAPAELGEADQLHDRVEGWRLLSQ
jgi:hypothetical protein